MNDTSVAPNLTLIKPLRFWVKCRHPRCHWLHEKTSEGSARTKALAHVATYKAHTVELHTVKTEVFHGEES